MLGLRALQRASRATSELHRCASNSAILNHLGRYYNPEREEDKTAFRQLFHQALGADRPAPLTVENELLRRHNSSLPTLVGQRVYGRILRLERQHAWIDVGYKGPVKVTKAELSASNLVASRGSSGSRVSPQDFQIGDVLTFLIEETADAFGDTVLSSAGARRQDTAPEKVMEQLQRHFREQIPVSGRLLNGTKGGYAIGVSGFVAFLPYASCSLPTASRVGVLQPFLIDKLDPGNMAQFVLRDPMHVPRATGETSKGPDFATQPIAEDLRTDWRTAGNTGM